jgi:SHS2 domain-containing protein
MSMVLYLTSVRRTAMERAPFEIVEHTADVAMVVRGEDMAGLLRHSARALYHLTVTGPGFAATHCRSVTIDSVDDDALLVDWLNELLYLLYAEHIAFSEFRFDELAAGRLTAQCCGELLKHEVHKMQREVKAATYHMAHIERVSEGYSARIILDV